MCAEHIQLIKQAQHTLSHRGLQILEVLVNVSVDALSDHAFACHEYLYLYMCVFADLTKKSHSFLSNVTLQRCPSSQEAFPRTVSCRKSCSMLTGGLPKPLSLSIKLIKQTTPACLQVGGAKPCQHEASPSRRRRSHTWHPHVRARPGQTEPDQLHDHPAKLQAQGVHCAKGPRLHRLPLHVALLYPAHLCQCPAPHLQRHSPQRHGPHR